MNLSRRPHHRSIATMTWPTIVWSAIMWSAVSIGGPRAEAAILANFDPATQQRFSSGTDPNATFFLDEADLRGIGINSRATLITPRHYVTAAHFRSTSANFRGADGVVRTYTTSGSTVIDTIDGEGNNLGPSDIELFTLTDPIPEADGVTALSVLEVDLAIAADALIGREMIVYDQNDRAGRNVIDDLGIAEFDGSGPPRPTYNVLYNYDTDANGGSGGLSDEAGLLGGDSGRAGLIDIDGTLAVIGTHYGIDVPMGVDPRTGGRYASLTTLLSPYLDDIEAITLAQGGYQLDRVSISAVPEPAGLAVWAMVGGGWIRLRRRRGTVCPNAAS